MPSEQKSQGKGARAAIAALAPCLLFCFFAPAALAGPPTHLRNEALDVSGLNHACGVATDSKGNLYVSSAGESKVKVFDPSHTELTSISNANESCGLAVDSKGQLYVSESKTGKVVRYKPNAYPFSGIPAYGAAEPIDSSGTAKGIAVDSHDDRLYVAEGTRISVYRSDGALDTVNEVQSATVNEATGGTFKLSFKGSETGSIPWNASAAEVETALKALPTIGAGNVSVAGSTPSYSISFIGTLAATDVEALKADATGLTGGASKGVSIKETVKGFNGHIGEGNLANATGVAAYTYVSKVNSLNETAVRYLFVADDVGTDQVKVFSGTMVRSGSTVRFGVPKLRKTITAVDQDRNPETPDQGLGFGAAGAYLAVDLGNRNAAKKCTSIAEQACTAGHFLVYDAPHDVVDEFEASGEFLDQIASASFSDAQPTGMAIDRSGGPNDGAIYVTAGAGAGARILALGPLAAPSRTPLPELSHALPGAGAVATDTRGDVYATAGALIHVYDFAGKEIKVGPEGKGIEDTHTPLDDIATDSFGNVYVLENGEQVTYYRPNTYPPVDGAAYTRHEPPIATNASLGENLSAVSVNPANDHVFVTGGTHTREYDSASNGSVSLNSKFAEGLDLVPRQSVGVYGADGKVYFGSGGVRISIVDAGGAETVSQITGPGCFGGELKSNPFVAVDQANGHVLEFQPGEAAREYDASGSCVAEFGGSTAVTRPYRIAIDNACALHDPPLTETTTPTCGEFDPANGTAYVAFDDTAPGTFDLTAFAPLAYGEPPLAKTGIASKVGGGSATLNGTVNPRGFDLAECKLEYLSDAQYLTNGKTFLGAPSVSCAESLAAIGKGSSHVSVHADLTGLDPAARYRFRLIAKNKYGLGEGDAWLFGPPLIATKPALPVLYHEATLRAAVDPSGLATEYRFEYGTSPGEYEQSTPAAKLPAGDGPVAVEAALTGLAEGETYHFRVVAENEAEEVPGPDQTLVMLQRRPAEGCPNVTYRTGLSANLPDCRAYELITPAETNGLSPEAVPIGSSGAADAGFNNWLVTPRGAGAGESLAYFTNGTLPGFEEGSGSLDGYRAIRGTGEHPAEGWRNEVFSPSYLEAMPSFLHPLSQQSVGADQLYSFWKIDPEEIQSETLPAGIYLQTSGGAAGFPCNPKPQQSRFELVGCGGLGTDPNATGKFVSPGGAHVIFGSKAHLEEAAAPGGTEAIYDRAAGSSSAEVVSVKPDGSPFGPGEQATFLGATEDGSAVVFRAGGTLYLHREGQSAEITAAPNTFASISEDGTQVFYAASGSGEAPAALFACEVDDGPCAGPGAHAPTPIATSSVFINVSPDGSHAFFSSEGAIPGLPANENGEVAEAGEDNLYAWNAGEIMFIGHLDPQDFVSFGGIPQMDLGRWSTAVNPGPTSGRGQSPTRATPDGEIFVFQSHAQLTAYENEGIGEIYRYDPAAAPGERTTCPSCDPTGVPPGADAMLVDINKGIDRRTLITNLTDSGEELFFESPERLLPEDANGLVDIYEWKARGAGGCERSGGCLALISSGQGDAPSHLYGMSADGHDVFFRTREALVGADIAGSPSIYDARIGGGIPEATAKAPCQGDACQGQGSTPPALGTPVSDGSGDGSFEEEPKALCAKGKRRIKGRCVRPHHKRHHHKRRRAAHNRGTGR